MTSRIKRTISAILTIAMIFTLLPAISTGGAAEPSEEPAAAITVTPEPLSETLRYQKGFHALDLTLPDTVAGTVGGVLQQIPVTWDSETDYTKPGLHIITAQPAEGYTFTPDAPIVTFLSESRVRLAGAGTELSPLEITTAAQLAEIAAMTNQGTLESFVLGNASAKIHIKLMSDIDLSVYAIGTGWTPIGVSGNPFKGNFDGNGKKITGLFINDDQTDDIGLFGYVDSGVVQKLAVAAADITGKDNAGILAGTLTNGGKIENCYTTGIVAGGASVGGIAGTVGGTGSGSVEKCYSTAAVTGIGNAGGIAGSVESGGGVKNCAALNPSITGSAAGRVVGASSGTLADNCAFSGMTGGSSNKTADGTDGADKTAAEVQVVTFWSTTVGWSGSIWTFAANKLPGFGAAAESPVHFDGSAAPYFEGNGTSADPYLIKTAAQLKKLAELVNAAATNTIYANKYYRLMNDIDLSDYGANFNNGEGWTPIGASSSSTNFKGHFDGGGNKISGLLINRSNSNYQGLFGYLYSDTSIKNGNVRKKLRCDIIVIKTGDENDDSRSEMSNM